MYYYIFIGRIYLYCNYAIEFFDRKKLALGAIRTWGTGITEKATQVVKGAGAALGTWIVIWCKIQDESDNIAYCAEIFSRCQSPGNHPSWVNNKPGTSESRCAECMFECTREGTWYFCSCTIMTIQILSIFGVFILVC